MSKRIILGIQVKNRGTNATQVQKILTDYGCNIKTRLGLHEVSHEICSTDGLLILEMFGESKLIEDAEAKLRVIDGVEVKKMIFH